MMVCFMDNAKDYISMDKMTEVFFVSCVVNFVFSFSVYFSKISRELENSDLLMDTINSKLILVVHTLAWKFSSDEIEWIILVACCFYCFLRISFSSK